MRYPNKMKWMGFFILGATFIGCTKKQIAIKGYRIQGPEDHWKSVAAGSADYAWYNYKIGATIYVDANCGSRFQDRPLHDSVYSMTAGIRTSEEPIERALFLDGREALMVQCKGKMDGVHIQMATVVLSKDRCLYDFVYMTRPEHFTAGFGDFHQLLHTFETRTSRTDTLSTESKR